MAKTVNSNGPMETGGCVFFGRRRLFLFVSGIGVTFCAFLVSLVPVFGGSWWILVHFWWFFTRFCHFWVLLGSFLPNFDAFRPLVLGFGGFCPGVHKVLRSHAFLENAGLMVPSILPTCGTCGVCGMCGKGAIGVCGICGMHVKSRAFQATAWTYFKVMHGSAGRRTHARREPQQ